MLKYDIDPQKYPVIYDNKFSITNLAQLLCRETEYSNFRNTQLLENPNIISGNFDIKHLCEIHRHLFQDVYPWAGQIREGNISKENSLFCPVKNIYNEFEKVTKLIKNFDKNGKSKIDVAKHLADVSDYINAIHPFREGNGRSKRTFLQLYADNLGYNLDYSQVGASELNKMEKEAFITCNINNLANLLSNCLTSNLMLEMLENAPLQKNAKNNSLLNVDVME